MSETYDVYQGQDQEPDADGQEWHVLVEYSNSGDRKPPTLVKFPSGNYASREEAQVEAERQAYAFDPPDPLAPQGRRVFRDGDGYLTIIEGAMSTFHFSTRVVRFLGDRA
jgi:hypothetical protein